MARRKADDAPAEAGTQPRPVDKPGPLAGDVSDAWELFHSGQLMPPRLWAAWMADRTGLETYETFYTASGALAGFGFTVQFERVVDGDHVGARRIGSSLNYLRPAVIARKVAARWKTGRSVLSEHELAEAIMLLDDLDQRGYALEGAGLKARDPEADADAAPLKQVKRFIKQLVMDHTMPGTEEAPRRRVLTEPREVFEAQLGQLQGGLVGNFLDGGAE